MKTIISIHSLRVEGDGWRTALNAYFRVFQSTPSVWRETAQEFVGNELLRFQSTPSVWRETHTVIRQLVSLDFNPLPPCGGRPTKKSDDPKVTKISIHSLRVEGDDHVRRASFGGWLISIHSLRVEGDSRHLSCLTYPTDFNPLPPCGGRPAAGAQYRAGSPFQSTPSVWRETSTYPPKSPALTISIHSLRVEGDQVRDIHTAAHHNFNPLPPCGGRRAPPM